MALLTNTSRTSTIKAETDCEVLRLERSSFLDLVREQPSVALAVAATLSRRLAGMLSHNSTSATAAASVPAGDESVADGFRGEAAMAAGTRRAGARRCPRNSVVRCRAAAATRTFSRRMACADHIVGGFAGARA